MLRILQRVHNLEVGVLPVLVHHDLVEVASVGALEPGALFKVLHHVLLHVEGAQGLQGARPPRAPAQKRFRTNVVFFISYLKGLSHKMDSTIVDRKDIKT
jgi:hypothetical protein